MKKLLVCLAAVLLLCAAFALSANAATVVSSGNCGANGANVTYTLDSDSVLTISGTGEMYYYSSSYAPWDRVRGSVKTVIINDGVTSIGSSAFYGCTGLTSVTISDSVTFIGGSAFSGCTGLTSVTIPNSVTSIGDFAFYGCTGLTSVTIPDSVTSIGYYAFYGCTGLTSVTIPDSVTFIVEGAFSGCTGLTSVTIPNSVTSIGDYAFYGCAGLTSVTIPNSVTSIGNSAFEGCTGLTSVTIPDSIVSIGHQVFRSCSGLVSVSLLCGDASFSAYYDEYTRSWLSNLFLGCPVSDLVVGDVLAGHTLQNLGFSKTSLQNVTILDGTTELMHRAFADYVNIKSIVIPDSVTEIGGVYY